MDAQTRVDILNEVIPLAVSFQYSAHRRILAAEDVAMAMELLGYSQVSLLSPFWPDVCFEGLEEDAEQSVEGGASPGDSNNGADNISVEEDEYTKHVLRRNKKLERYLFERNPTEDKALREVNLGRVNPTIRARLVPDPTLVCRLSASGEWKAENLAKDDYKVGGIGPMDGIPESLPPLSEAEQSFACATSDLLQNIPTGGLATIYQLLDLVANHRHGQIALLLIARFVQSTVDKFVSIGGIGSIPLRYMRLLALLARGSVLVSAGRTPKNNDGADTDDDDQFEVSLCSLVGSSARLALDTSLPQSMAQSAQGGGYPMSPILPPRGSQTPRNAGMLGGAAGAARQHSGVAAAVCDALQLVSFRDMCSKCFKECLSVVSMAAPKLAQHVDVCVEDRWTAVLEKNATTRADLMALVSVMSLVKEGHFVETSGLCSRWLAADAAGESNSSSSSSSPPDVSDFERELSLVYLEQKAKLSDYFLATSLLLQSFDVMHLVTEGKSDTTV
ncbi:hypothetical protein FOZ60_012048 [Perkinsus olseni]|uniref:Uncharacterized protein n=1 Tax=Perkinsus olseni TaxID=32597 RepID=A0A7J6NCB3_PEROL|nr:hypothetical protein FOZ60_012048 [Perkinsus olseni]